MITRRKAGLDGWITVREAMEILGLTRVPVIRQIHRGKIRAVRVGKQFLLDRESVERYKAERYARHGRNH